MACDFKSYMDGYLDRHRHNIIGDLIELVKIESLISEPEKGAPYGKPIRQSLEKIGSQMAGLGHAFKIAEHGAYGYCEYGNGPKVIGLIPHLDIVNANGTWSFPPFDPTVWNGYVIGRGASDNKGGVIASLYAFDALVNSGIPIRNRVRLIFGCDEETGMSDMEHLMDDGMAPDFSLIPDAFFPIGVGEKGRMQAVVRDNDRLCAIRYFLSGQHNGTSVPDYACCRIEYSAYREEEIRLLCAASDGCMVKRDRGELVVEAAGVSAHPAMPKSGLDAGWKIAKLLKDANSLPKADRMAMEKLEKMTNGFGGGKFGLDYEDEISGGVTCACIHAQAIDGFIESQYNVRFCVSLKKARIEWEFRAALGRYGCAMGDYTAFEPYYYPEDDVIRALKGAFTSVCGQKAELYVHPGETYAGKLGNAVIFGNEFRKDSPFGVDKGRAHQVDECTGIEDLMMSIRLYAQGILAVDKAIGGN